MKLRGQFNQLLVLLGLTSFSITEPVLTIFGANPTIFYFYDVDTPAIVVSYTLIVAFSPALFLWAATEVTRFLGERVAVVMHHLIVGLLGGLWTLQLFKWQFDVSAILPLVLCSVLGGLLVLLCYAKWRIFGAWLRIAAVGQLILVIAFLFFSNAAGLIKSKQQKIVRANVTGIVPSVLFIMLDEFPTLYLLDQNGLLDQSRYPHLARFAQTATWYRHYSVLADRTDLSVPSILSGISPKALPPSMPHYPNNMFTLLAPTHQMTVFEMATELCGFSGCGEAVEGEATENKSSQLHSLLQKSASVWLKRVSFFRHEIGLLDDFEERLDPLQVLAIDNQELLLQLLFSEGATQAAQSRPERLERFIDNISPQREPSLYYLHLALPHLPWRTYETGEIYGVSSKRPLLSINNADGGEWLTRLSEHRFLMQAQYTDLLLGEVFAHLKSLGRWDETLVVVTADHGRSFRPHTSLRMLQPGNIDGIVYTPLFIKRPYQKSGEIDDSNLMAYDVLPTIANILDINVPWPLDGFPAGHQEITRRGDQKEAFMKNEGESIFANSIGKKFLFNDSEHFPDYSSRRIGVLRDTRGSLLELLRPLELDQFIGRSPGEFERMKQGIATIDDLKLLQHPTTGKPSIGVMVGNLEFETSASKILISINGEFVSGSPLLNFRGINNTFIAMLPPKTLGQNNEIGVYAVEADKLIEVEIQ